MFGVSNQSGSWVECLKSHERIAEGKQKGRKDAVENIDIGEWDSGDGIVRVIDLMQRRPGRRTWAQQV